MHSVALLIGYGAGAVNPYLMLESPRRARRAGLAAAGDDEGGGPRARRQGHRQGAPQGALEDGHLDRPLVLRRADLRGGRASPPRSSTGTSPAPRRASAASASAQLAREALERHARAYPGTEETLLPVVGLYAWRRDGEHHQWNPDTIAKLQHAVRSDSWETYEQYAAAVNNDNARRLTLRGLMQFRFPEGGGDPGRRGRARRRDRASASPPARCRSARSRARRTRRSRSR